MQNAVCEMFKPGPRSTGGLNGMFQMNEKTLGFCHRYFRVRLVSGNMVLQLS
jgi:hypothetical protein